MNLLAPIVQTLLITHLPPRPYRETMDICRCQRFQKGSRLTVRRIVPMLTGAHHVLTEELHKGSFGVLPETSLRCDWQGVLAGNWIGNMCHIIWK